jgi:hypothetical protein
MDIIAAQCQHLMHVLAVDVELELDEAYPEELKHKRLREIKGKRPDPRARCRTQKLTVHKYVHLTPMQRYERAQIHAALLPKALRLADFLLLGSMLDLAQTSVEVRWEHAACMIASCASAAWPALSWCACGRDATLICIACR